MDFNHLVGVGAGGIHVDASFETFLREHLKSRSNHPQFEAIISDSVDDFESHTKRSFRTNSTRSKVRVRIGAEWQLPDLNIQNGHLVLDRLVRSLRRANEFLSLQSTP